MSVRDEPERIEVELTSDAPGSGVWPTEPSRPAGATPAGATPAGAADRGRNARVGVLVVLVGLVGVVVGWALGRSGDEPDPAGVEAAAVTAVAIRPVEAATASTTVPPRVVPIAPVTPLLGDAEPLVTRVIGLPAPVSGQALEVVTYGNGRTLSRLDLSDGTLRTQVVQRHAFGRPRVLVGTDWILMPSPDGETPSLVIDADGEVTTVDFGADRRVVTVSELERVWSSTPELGVEGAGAIEATTIAGDVLGTIDLTATPVGADPGGGFVVRETGGWYHVGATSARITSGELIALGDELALARECDESLTCDVVAIDRVTGDRRIVATSWPDRDGAPVLRLVSTRSVSPDGRQAIVVVDNPADRSSVQPVLGVVSLESGVVVEVGPAQDADQSAWTPDGRFVIYNRGGRINAFDTSTGDGFDVSDELIGVDAFAVRPPLPRVGF